MIGALEGKVKWGSIFNVVFASLLTGSTVFSDSIQVFGCGLTDTLILVLEKLVTRVKQALR